MSTFIPFLELIMQDFSPTSVARLVLLTCAWLVEQAGALHTNLFNEPCTRQLKCNSSKHY
jgi:hypothetical protein